LSSGFAAGKSDTVTVQPDTNQKLVEPSVKSDAVADEIEYRERLDGMLKYFPRRTA
jgi:hypothetical protein